MPTKRIYVKKKRKKWPANVYVKKIPLRRNRVAYGKPQSILPFGFAKTTVMRFRYVANPTLNPGIGSVAYHRFRANGCFDPNFEVGGHQPYGWDQMVVYYNHYVVLGSKCTVRMSPSGTSNDSFLMGGILLKADSATPGADITEVLERNMVSAKAIGSTNRNVIKTFSKGYSAKKFFNVKNVSDNTNRIGAPTNADPVDHALFHVWATSTDVAADPGVVNCVVTLEYTVLFSEPKALPQS